jgi:hypothetical protein
METAEQEHRQGLTADEKHRRALAGRELTRRTELIRRHRLSIDDQRRMATWDPNDPEVSAYIGFPEVQADAIKDDQAARESARRIAYGSLRAHLPAAAILGIEQASPVDMMPGEDNIVLGEN